MKTREEFMDQFQDELNGLLLAAWAEERKHTDFARDGAWMVQQMRRGRKLLEKMFLFMDQPITPPATPAPKKVEQNGLHAGTPRPR